MTDPVDELNAVLASVRRQLRASDVEETRQLADLTDGTLVWLLANHWVPPEPPTPSRPVSHSGSGNTFVLTEAEVARYKRVVSEAQQIKELLRHEEEAVYHYGINSPAYLHNVQQLKVELQKKADEIRAMSEAWKVE